MDSEPIVDHPARHAPLDGRDEGTHQGPLIHEEREVSRVAHVDAVTVEVPCRFPIVSAIRRADTIVNVLVTLHTDDGALGSAYVAGFTRAQARAIHFMVDELTPHIRGLPITETTKAWQEMNRASQLLGRGGAGTAAMSALDIAMWDAKALRLGAPLHELLGTARRQIPAYASDGCWLSQDPKKVASEAGEFVDEGFGAIKVRLGRARLEHDLEVLDMVRSSVGPEVELLVDANQAWTLDVAKRAGRQLESRGITWLEEPLSVDDVLGLSELRQCLTLQIVAGESVHLPSGIEALIRHRAVSVLMPDIQRIGGITGWIRASAVAETAGLQISAHLFPEISIHLLAASLTGGPLEYVSWMEPFVKDPLTIEDGLALVPDRPGLGLEFDWSRLKQYVLG